ncbi:putative bifunctional diguanylate cyclase/phosphodiesterase [Aidingimonas halophila]|uniref:cyclic-guanylate-specific phosphodiesterase n=1 Tax=Aidingimonas halophila TaxID=574349 RepID=A0A1H2Y7Q9_9GAMM|nr:EAL domain-containing protein [Aidingimonas halophila]GHC34612.1 hypothetical protein GCM10008094_29480 [Aidingimonas halophila]SDX01176.1 PAS domain S-box-containing protein/diguanylate cyclase (GGDEF) domain-containing protein [Aidingimonas halophila]
MPFKTRDIALDTGLLMVAATFILMGVGGLLANSVETMSYSLRTLVVSDAALSTLLAGIALVATIQRKPWIRCMAGAALLAVMAYTLIHNVMVGGNVSGLSWISGEQRISSAAALQLLLVAGCLVMGVTHPWKRRLWSAMGVLLLGFGGILLIWLFLPSGETRWASVYASSPWVAVLYTLLFGVAMVAVGIRYPARDMHLGRMAIAVCVLGVTVSSLSWYLVTWQQQHSLHEQADYLLDNLQLNIEQVMEARLTRLQRMAERWEPGEHPQGNEGFLRDAENHLRDIPSLGAVAILDEAQQWVVGRARDAASRDWLSRQVAKRDIEAWMMAPFSQPRLMVPDESGGAVALLVAPIPGQNYQLVAMMDLPLLLENQLRAQLGPFEVTASRGNSVLLDMVAAGSSTVSEVPDLTTLEQRSVGMPGGPVLDLGVHLAPERNWLMAGGVSTGVIGVGLTMSYLLGFSLGLVRLVMMRSRALMVTQRSLEEQQHIQALIVREAPLERTLASVCRMLEKQLAGVHCAVMMSDAEGKTLRLASGQRLPLAYQQALARLPIDPCQEVSSAAAYHRRPIICHDTHRNSQPDINHDLTRQHGFRACCSYPVVATDGRLLGTFATYSDAPSSPSRDMLEAIRKAAGLVALAIERHQDRRSLWESEQRYRSLFVYNPDAVFSLDLEGRFVTANTTCMELTGRAADTLVGASCFSLATPGQQDILETHFRHAVAGNPCRYEIEITDQYGETHILDMTHLPIMVDGQVHGVYGIAKEITEHKAHQAQLAYHASHDFLTGLANRTFFEGQLNEAFRRARRQNDRLAVLFVDLDEFKPINDSLGHDVGDQLLVNVASRLTGAMRSTDILARLGGDEFVILMDGLTDEAEVSRLATRLLPLISSPYRIAGHELYLSCSIGIAVSDEKIVQPMELIQQADMAMYKAKSQGRNAYQWYTREITDKVNARVALRNELQEAIDNAHFVLHYQPLLDLDGRVVGVEALIRWPHPEKGFIPPDQFIPLAEETGQIIAINEWVLDRACRDVLQLREQELGELVVSVNLSPLQFRRSRFLDNLYQTLATTGLPARQLELELTEGILMDDAESAISILHELRRLGISVAIDDFGTGFSSLSYLKHLPIGKIKIDRTFIRDVESNRHDASIVQGIVSMSHHLGLTVVAEGVETEAQKACLMRFGCDILQGYLFARPMPLDALITYLSSQEA